jgi:hypothetical protein
MDDRSAVAFDLGGTWSRLLNGKQIDYVAVPGSYRPLGECVLERAFDCPATASGISSRMPSGSSKSTE